MPRFDNQTVLVTGGTGGQGSSHVRAFHAEGANVVIGDIDAERGAVIQIVGSTAASTRSRPSGTGYRFTTGATT